MAQQMDLNRCRTLLAGLSTGKSDEEITRLRNGAYELASALAESFSELRAGALSDGLDTLEPIDLVANALKWQFFEDEDEAAERESNEWAWSQAMYERDDEVPN
jgi:hypothetical protein